MPISWNFSRNAILPASHVLEFKNMLAAQNTVVQQNFLCVQVCPLGFYYRTTRFFDCHLPLLSTAARKPTSNFQILEPSPSITHIQSELKEGSSIALGVNKSKLRRPGPAPLMTARVSVGYLWGCARGLGVLFDGREHMGTAAARGDSEERGVSGVTIDVIMIRKISGRSNKGCDP